MAVDSWNTVVRPAPAIPYRLGPPSRMVAATGLLVPRPQTPEIPRLHDPVEPRQERERATGGDHRILDAGLSERVEERKRRKGAQRVRIELDEAREAAEAELLTPDLGPRTALALHLGEHLLDHRFVLEPVATLESRLDDRAPQRCAGRSACCTRLVLPTAKAPSMQIFFWIMTVFIPLRTGCGSPP